MAKDKELTNQNHDNEQVSNLPQVVTESYGTGVADEPGNNIGDRKLKQEIQNNHQADPILTAGDVDAAWETAAVTGDEAVGGTAPTPDQDIVDEVAAAVGIEMDDKAFLRTTDMMEQRDDRRWELNPQSSEDYQQRKVQGQEGEMEQPDRA
ncbi:MAG: DUF6335 family protein [Scytonema sp. PMC 1069.18]|nr:DUF6335 family protein [Scytonema sp. PMC 1069.18]MEC4886135.1 DUF6335 family protein [Scytonema sp. PMC 1070.18]